MLRIMSSGSKAQKAVSPAIVVIGSDTVDTGRVRVLLLLEKANSLLAKKG